MLRMSHWIAVCLGVLLVTGCFPAVDSPASGAEASDPFAEPDPFDDDPDPFGTGEPDPFGADEPDPFAAPVSSGGVRRGTDPGRGNADPFAVKKPTLSDP